MKTTLDSDTPGRERILLSRWLMPLLILVAVVAAYANSFTAPFIFDDKRVIVQDPHLAEFWPIALKSRIVTVLTFRLNYAVGGLNHADYHAVNLALHIVAALLLYGLVRRTLLLPVLRRRYGRHATGLAGLIALVWAVHPLQTESVTYICQRFEVMMGVFFLLAFYSFVRGITAGARKSGKVPGWFVLSVMACAVGMGTKEVTVTLPVLLLLYDYMFCAGGNWATVRSRWKMHLALFGSCSVYVLLMFWEMAAGNFHAAGTVFSIPVHRYLFTQFGIVLHYLRLSIVPYPLCFDYGWMPAEGIGEILLPGLVIAGLLVLTAAAIWRRNPAGFLGAWFFVILAPTSSVLPIADMAFEHRMYLPLAGVIVALVIAGARRVDGFARRHAAPRRVLLAGNVAAVLIVAGLAFLAYRRNEVYASETRLWRDVVAKCPENLRGYQNLATALLDDQDLDGAAVACAALLKRLPDFSTVSYDELLSKEGTSDGRQSFRLAYEYAGVQNTLGLICLQRGQLLRAAGHFQESVRIAPGNCNAWSNLALVQHRRGKAAAAIDAWKRALALRPERAAAHRGIAEAYLANGEQALAARHYEDALKLDSRDVRAQLGLAWLLSVSKEPGLRDGKRAIMLTSEIKRSVPGSLFRVLVVEAAAYAEAGQMDTATRILENVMDRSLTPTERERREFFLGLYRAGRLFRSSDPITDLFWETDDGAQDSRPLPRDLE